MKKTVVITGAASGIGRATSILFARNNWRVCASDINSDALSSLLQQIGDEHLFSIVDVANSAQLKDYFRTVREFSRGKVDALINNAGILCTDHFEKIPLEDHEKLISININGVVTCASEAFDLLKNTNNSCLINLSSASADYGVPSLASYSASKFFVKGFTEALSVEWLRHDIHVCLIAPHFVDTGMTKNRGGIFSKGKITVTPEDVAKVIYRAANNRTRHSWRVENNAAYCQRMIMKIMPNFLLRKLIGSMADY